MTRRVVFRPQAEDEIAEAAEWYEARDRGLGTEFLRSMDACIAAIERNPSLCEKVFGDVRRAVLRRFPYILVYTFDEEEIVIAACVHGRRDPKRWQGRV